MKFLSPIFALNEISREVSENFVMGLGIVLKLILSIAFAAFWVNVSAEDVLVIDLQEASLPERMAALTCQGLMNRDGLDAVYTIKDGWDEQWLATALDLVPGEIVNVPLKEFLEFLCEQEKFGTLIYSKSEHHEVIPQIITLAGVLDAVPLDVDSGMDQISTWMDHEVVFDARIEFLGFTEVEATAYVFDNYANLTTGVGMMNPGWKQPDDFHPIQHELVKEPGVGLTDFIVKNRIFNFFLYLGCVPLTDAHALLERMMTDGSTPWKKPVEVYGYNDAVHFFGSIFEAETNCISAHNMGQVASSDQNNFSFFNRREPIQSPDDLEQYLDVLMKTRDDIADGTLVYDPNKTYMTFILGDGDNIAFMKGGRRGWMEERLQICEERGGCDFPLVWTISPHLLYMGPDYLTWYYSKANETGQDVFVLPPSGHLYAYPGMMNGPVLDAFVEQTNQDCKLMSSTGSVHWEWFYGWQQAFDRYFPKYSVPDSCIKSFFSTNVPYNFLTNVVWPDYFIALDEDIIVFKPREWRGTDTEGEPPFSDQNFLTEEEMAAEINGYDKGSVSHLYLTSDGGMNLEILHTMIDLLDDHVKVVNHEELTEMARQKTALQKQSKH